MNFKVISGSPASIPEGLGHKRNRYNWDALNVGDHVEFPDNDEGRSARSAGLAFARGNNKRAPRNFATQTVEDNGQKIVQIWRLADPVPSGASAIPTVAAAQAPADTSKPKSK